MAKIFCEGEQEGIGIQVRVQDLPTEVVKRLRTQGRVRFRIPETCRDASIKQIADMLR